VFKRPSSRRKSHHGPLEINLVPILDTMVTLIGFLLFTTSFLSIVAIESPLPQSSPAEVADQIKEKPLQLTLTLREKTVELWSPFSKIETKIIPHSQPGQPDLKAIHEALIEVKKKFPEEQSAVIVPEKETPYDTLIGLMDTLRTLEASDPPIYVKNQKTGMDETLKQLFPKVIFGNLLGES
jgi:biopolymer transport protein ExbD